MNDSRLNVVVPTELHQRLEAEAAAREVPLAWLVRRLLLEGVGRLKPADEFTLTRPAPTLHE